MDVLKYCTKKVLFNDTQNTELTIKYLLNGFGLSNFKEKLLTSNGVVDLSFYSRKEVQNQVDLLLRDNKIDVIYTTSGMAGYVAKSKLPKIVDAVDINYPTFLDYFINETNLQADQT